MSIIYVVTSATVYDCAGEVIDEGEVIAVCRSRAGAEYRLQQFKDSCRGSNYGRADYDYEINEMEVED